MMITMMMMLMVTITIIMAMMLMLMLSRIAFFNSVSKEKYEEVHPKQSALATAHHGMCLSVFTQSISVVLQVVQHCLASSDRLFNTVIKPQDSKEAAESPLRLDILLVFRSVLSTSFSTC